MTSSLGGPTASVHPGGAPLGNQNARKHGLYSVRPAKEPRPGPPDLNTDITNLRAYMQRIVDVYADTRVPEEVAFVLRQLTVASLGLSRLARTQLFANPPEPERDELLDEISSVAEEVHQRMVPEGQVICPNCRQDTTLLSLSRVAATCNVSGQPHLTFAFRRNGALVGIPEYQDELERCHGKDFADRQVIPRPDAVADASSPSSEGSTPLSGGSSPSSEDSSPPWEAADDESSPPGTTEELDEISQHHDLTHPESLTSDPQPSADLENLQSLPLSSTSFASSSDLSASSANSVSSVVNLSSSSVVNPSPPRSSLRNQRLFQRRFRETTPARPRDLASTPPSSQNEGPGEDSSSPAPRQPNHPP